MPHRPLVAVQIQNFQVTQPASPTPMDSISTIPRTISSCASRRYIHTPSILTSSLRNMQDKRLYCISCGSSEWGALEGPEKRMLVRRRMDKQTLNKIEFPWQDSKHPLESVC